MLACAWTHCASQSLAYCYWWVTVLFSKSTVALRMRLVQAERYARLC
jgi:hypothetical protein